MNRRTARVLVCLLVALALAPAAHALKKKKRSLQLGEVSRKLEKYEGTNLSPGKVKYTTFGDREFDDFSRKAAEVRLLGTFANKSIKDANRKLDGAKSEKDINKIQGNLDMAKMSLDHIQTEGPKLVTTGETLLKKLPAKLARDPQGYAKNLDAMKEIVVDGVKVGSQTPAEAAKLIDRLARVGAKVAKKKAKLR